MYVCVCVWGGGERGVLLGQNVFPELAMYLENQCRHCSPVENRK